MVTAYHVIGASGRSGAALCRSLLSDGVAYMPVVRSAPRWAATGLPGAPCVADLDDGSALRGALAGAVHIVSCAHARFVPAILAAAPPEASFVLLGSTRKFTRWPDAHARGVLAGEAAFLASGRDGVMLHPTMIYGAEGEDNVQRLAALLRRLPVIPLPAGGTALVQPIFQDDVTRCLRRALHLVWSGPSSIVIAGPHPVCYAVFVREVAHSAGLHAPHILPVPAGPLRLAARLSGALPFLPRIEPDEIRRLGEDKAFDILPMQRSLGVAPLSLQDGLSRCAWTSN